MQREIKLFVVSDDRHRKHYIEARIGEPGNPDDVIDLGLDARTEHASVHNLLFAIGAENNHNMVAVDPSSLPASRGEVAKEIDQVMVQVKALIEALTKRPNLPGDAAVAEAKHRTTRRMRARRKSAQLRVKRGRQ